MKIQERKNRVIARGEHSNHIHVIIGDAFIRNERGQILIDIEGDASIRHILEDAWLAEEKEVWTGEHEDIRLADMPAQVRQGDVMLEKVSEKTYRFIQQCVYDPLSKRIEAARD